MRRRISYLGPLPMLLCITLLVGCASAPQGFDCSGLVRYAYLAAGRDVPRTTSEQFRTARSIRQRKLEAGDLLFFRIDSREVTHVAIYTGHGRFVHAPQSGKSVETRALDDEWYADRLVGAGRLH